jgi:hypothetical protein
MLTRHSFSPRIKRHLKMILTEWVVCRHSMEDTEIILDTWAVVMVKWAHK